MLCRKAMHVIYNHCTKYSYFISASLRLLKFIELIHVFLFNTSIALNYEHLVSKVADVCGPLPLQINQNAFRMNTNLCIPKLGSHLTRKVGKMREKLKHLAL